MPYHSDSSINHKQETNFLLTLLTFLLTFLSNREIASHGKRETACLGAMSDVFSALVRDCGASQSNLRFGTGRIAPIALKIAPEKHPPTSISGAQAQLHPPHLFANLIEVTPHEWVSA